MKWRWLKEEVLIAVHDEQLAEHGGTEGVRDSGLLFFALARPKNLAEYEKPSAFDLAAAYAAGIVRNHPFVDGNKRTGFLAAYMFLALNGWNWMRRRPTHRLPYWNWRLEKLTRPNFPPG
jgi:death-on-curing protein